MKLSAPDEIAVADAVAVIDESRCIGCTLCIQACPVDAIVGAARLMHTVLGAACTGCELCIAPCPVDCISVRPLSRPGGEARLALTRRARERCEARNLRLRRLQVEKAAQAAARRAPQADATKKAVIARAVERARRRLNGRNP